MSRVIHFEMGVDEPERAVAFHETVFGWKTNKWDGPQAYCQDTEGNLFGIHQFDPSAE